MRLVATIESHFYMQTAVLYNTEFVATGKPIVQPNCMIAPRGEAIPSVMANRPIAVVSLVPYVNGAIDMSHLRFIQCTVGIKNYDLFAVGSTIVPEDSYNLYSNLFATMGRLKFDLSNYQVSIPSARLINRSPAAVKLAWKTQIFSRD